MLSSFVGSVICYKYVFYDVAVDKFSFAPVHCEGEDQGLRPAVICAAYDYEVAVDKFDFAPVQSPDMRSS
jgi:hypothetical protein